ncbi:MAG: hypothetical protein BWZ09_01708 [Alphaproteobacteria bacterium ADurb.BinA305]|nr:MAG: hypothetical protein BWZ09_01708 [Alphaproteobacteria bacterium ADurb.BinA305]
MFNKPNLFHGTGEVSAQRNAQRTAGTNVAAVPVTAHATLRLRFISMRDVKKKPHAT